MRKTRVLLADDHRIVLEGLRRLLDTEFELAGTATNGHELIAQARVLQPDVVVADISMPLLNGIDAARVLLEEDPRIKVVFLTMHPDQAYASRALEAGATGYVLKHSASDELVTAIREVMRGGVFLSEALRTEAAEELLSQTRPRLKQTIELTGRQREVVQLLAEGKSAKEIAAILQISPRTVETHKYKIMDDLGLKTSAEVVQYAIKHGIVPV
jgi:DNA-binding NarL/FixJ family response regulator